VPPADNYIVEDVLTDEGFTPPYEGCLEHDTLIPQAFTSQDRLECSVDFVLHDLGEEAEVAHVDPKDGNLSWGRHTDGSEESAVTAYNYKKVRSRPDIVRRCMPHGGGQVVFYETGDFTFLDPGGYLCRMN
jgi:hypothetical protein